MNIKTLMQIYEKWKNDINMKQINFESQIKSKEITFKKEYWHNNDYHNNSINNNNNNNNYNNNYNDDNHYY